MKYKHLILIPLAGSIISCGGGSGSEASDNILTTIVTEQDENDYKKNEYAPYGFFYGSFSSSSANGVNILIIDEATNVFSNVTIYGSSYEFITGEYYRDSSNSLRYGSANNGAKVYYIDSDFFERGSSDDEVGIRRHFNYTANNRYSWDLELNGNDATLFPNLTQTITSSNIIRDMIYPSKLSFIEGNYLSDVIYYGESLTTSLSIDIDGDISGVDNEGCLISGRASITNKNVNSYSVNMTFENCSNDLNNGQYTGLLSMNGFEGTESSITERLEGNSLSIEVMIHNDNRAIYIWLMRD